MGLEIKYIDLVYVHLISYHLHNKYHHVSGDNRIVHYPDHQYGMFLHFDMLVRPELDIYLKFRKHRLLNTYCSIILFATHWKIVFNIALPCSQCMPVNSFGQIHMTSLFSVTLHEPPFLQIFVPPGTHRSLKKEI